MTTTTTRSAVRRLIQDGQTSDATPIAYNIARLEDLSDQIPAVATPTQTTFLLRFSSVPVEEYLTVFAVPGTLRAYVDGSTSPATVASDVDVNGSFALAAAPLSSLKVTYVWQFFVDADVDQLVDQARAWLGFVDVPSVPDGLTPALTQYAGYLAAKALARKCALADASAGDASIQLSQIATRYQAVAAELRADAVASRNDFYVNPQRLGAAAGQTFSFPVDPFQPRR